MHEIHRGVVGGVGADWLAQEEVLRAPPAVLRPEPTLTANVRADDFCDSVCDRQRLARVASFPRSVIRRTQVCQRVETVGRGVKGCRVIS